MKNTIRKITALTLAVLTLGASTSCGRDKPEEINDSQESSSEDEVGSKTKITIGMPLENVHIMSQIVEFNNTNELYEVEIIDYSKRVEDDDAGNTKAMQAMKMDMISDNSPDIIAGLHPTDMAEFLQKDAFADMYELMDTYDGVKREDFLPNVLEGLEVNGEIPAITESFTIRTAVAKTKFVGEEAENWTPEQAIEAYKKYSEQMQYIGMTDSEDALSDYMLLKASRNCVNAADYTCNFINTEFTSLLDFLHENPSQGTYPVDYTTMTPSEFDAFFAERDMQMYNDKSLIYCTYISDFDQAVGKDLYARFGGEDITFVGYPSEDGNGAVTEASWMFGISERSENKEAAWSFINSLFEDEAQRDFYGTNTGIPVIKKYLDEQKNNKDTEDVHSIYSPLVVPGDHEISMNITEEAVQKYYDYILSVEFEPYRDFRVEEIIREECAAALAGEKSAEEVAEILQGRVEIYLSERS